MKLKKVNCFFSVRFVSECVDKVVYAVSAWVLAKGLLICWDTIIYYDSHSFTVQLVSFYFKNKWQVFLLFKATVFSK